VVYVRVCVCTCVHVRVCVCVCVGVLIASVYVGVCGRLGVCAYTSKSHVGQS